MDWLFEADRDAERRFPWISIPGVASIDHWDKWVFGTTFGTSSICLQNDLSVDQSPLPLCSFPSLSGAFPGFMSISEDSSAPERLAKTPIALSTRSSDI